MQERTHLQVKRHLLTEVSAQSDDFPPDYTFRLSPAGMDWTGPVERKRTGRLQQQATGGGWDDFWWPRTAVGGRG